MKIIQDPNFMYNMMEQNPYVKKLVNANPEMKNMLTQPEMFTKLTAPGAMSQALDTIRILGDEFENKNKPGAA
jgi:hypothetical protein